MEDKLYHYRIRLPAGKGVKAIYDADTIRADLDFGDGIWRPNRSIRLVGIDTAEMKSKTKEAKMRAISARDYVRDICGRATDLIVKSRSIEADGDEKFGRMLAILWAKPREGTWLNVNQSLIDLGHAKPYDGRAKEKWE